ncbi:MAG: DsbA family protein [Acidimicrobiales bacterium]
MTVHPRLPLIIYGDFNCPFSALASARARHLEREGLAEVDWRSVKHVPDIPAGGHPVVGTRRDELQRGLDQVRSLLTGGEPDRLTLPIRLANTRLAVLAYANAPRTERQEVRERLFDAYWTKGRGPDRPDNA